MLISKILSFDFIPALSAEPPEITFPIIGCIKYSTFIPKEPVGSACDCEVGKKSLRPTKTFIGLSELSLSTENIKSPE